MGKVNKNRTKSSNRRAGGKSRTLHRWGIILAGGDGTRLRSLTRLITGDDRPKQFCKILGDKSLLERTISRVEMGIRRSNILLSVTRTHEIFYNDLIGSFDKSKFVEQPANLGTAPAILYSLIRTVKADPEAIVTFFPSDHYLSDDRDFMKQVNKAYEGVERSPGMIALLGITPATAETEYGWIEPETGNDAHRPGPLMSVRRFWEKPDKKTAVELFSKGCLWNSFVMTGRADDFLSIIAMSVPTLYREFLSVSYLIGTPSESEALDYVYEKLTPINFSHRVLEPSTRHLLTLAVKDIEWSDLGDPGRVISTLENIGINSGLSLSEEGIVRKTA